jgi:hypothetical protein
MTQETEQQEAQGERRRGNAPNVDEKYTWEDTAKYIGTDYSGGIIMVADEMVDKVMISRYCEPAEIGCLIYWDEAIARMAGYRSQVVPWAMVKEVPTYMGNWRPGQETRYPLDADPEYQARLASRSPSVGGPPRPPTNAGFFTDMDIEFFEPLCIGDRVTTMGHVLHHVIPRETRVGVGAFVGNTTSYFNQFGQCIAKATQGSYSFNRKAEEDIIR